ncbi:hypothetical protein WJX77_010247 [Trebouxia sp. C0004]
MFPLVIQDCVHAYEEFLSAPGMAIEPCIASGGVEKLTRRLTGLPFLTLKPPVSNVFKVLHMCSSKPPEQCSLACHNDDYEKQPGVL